MNAVAAWLRGLNAEESRLRIYGVDGFHRTSKFAQGPGWITRKYYNYLRYSRRYKRGAR